MIESQDDQDVIAYHTYLALSSYIRLAATFVASPHFLLYDCTTNQFVNDQDTPLMSLLDICPSLLTHIYDCIRHF